MYMSNVVHYTLVVMDAALGIAIFRPSVRHSTISVFWLVDWFNDENAMKS